MPSEVDSPRACRFGGFEVDFRAGQLRRNGSVLPIQPKALELLRALLEKPGEVITREQLRLKLWGTGTFVEFDDSLNHAVKKLRQALGDTSEAPRFIETLPRHGYRFIAAVEVLALDENPANTPVDGSRRRILVIAALVMVLAGAGGYGVLTYLRPSGPPPVDRVMLAVLPFENLSGDESQEYVSDGFTEELLTELARANPAQLGVIARTSTTRFKNTEKSIGEIGRELGVGYVVEGSVRRDGLRMRVAVQLIRVEDQTHVWASAYDRDSSSVLDLETEIAAQVGQSLAIRLLPRRQDGAVSAHQPTPDAREARLRGRYHLARRSGESIVKAQKEFERALALDPDYPEACADLAKTYVLLANYGVLPQGEGKPKAKAAALKALQLDPSLSDARIVLAGIVMEFEWNFTGAEADFARVIGDDPNNAFARQWYSALLWSQGRFDEAIHQMKLACQLDPLSLSTIVDLGRAYYFARRYDEAIAQYRKALDMDRNYAAAHSYMGLALLEQQQHTEAIAELETGIGLMRGARSIYLPYGHAVAGNTEKARALLGELLQEQAQWPLAGAGIALAYVGLGEHDRAFEWLEREFAARSGVIVMLKAHPYWDPIRSDPRYSDLVRRAGLRAD